MAKVTHWAGTLGLLLFFMFLTGCATTGGAPLSGLTKFNEFTDDIQVSDSLTLSVKEAMEHHGVQGVTVIGIDNGTFVGFEFHGIENHVAQTRTDQDTIYQAASMSKLVAGLAMAQADRTNLISLDTNVPTHVSQHFGETISGWYTREFTTTTEKRWAEDVTMRLLLQSAAGLDRKTTGTACSADDTSISTFLGTFSTPCSKCVRSKREPATKWKYSSGGFVVAEAMFEEQSGRSARNYLNKDFLEELGLTKSTFKNASTDISNLATGCDTTVVSGVPLCACDHEIAKVKFPGGLLANPLEFAQLLVWIANDGLDYEGNQKIDLNDIREVISPAYHKNSSLQSCQPTSSCPGGETCVAERCMDPLGKKDDWYGMGVHMSPTLADNGYPRELHHTGGQPGFSSYFNIDLESNDGVVVFINNTPGAGKPARKGLVADIKDAFKRHYR